MSGVQPAPGQVLDQWMAQVAQIETRQALRLSADVPTLVSMVRRCEDGLQSVLALHQPAHIYPLLDVPGAAPDTDAEPLMTYCTGCTPADTCDAIETGTWDDSMDTVAHPCAEVASISKALGEAL